MNRKIKIKKVKNLAEAKRLLTMGKKLYRESSSLPTSPSSSNLYEGWVVGLPAPDGSFEDCGIDMREFYILAHRTHMKFIDAKIQGVSEREKWIIYCEFPSKMIFFGFENRQDATKFAKEIFSYMNPKSPNFSFGEYGYNENYNEDQRDEIFEPYNEYPICTLKYRAPDILTFNDLINEVVVQAEIITNGSKIDDVTMADIRDFYESKS